MMSARITLEVIGGDPQGDKYVFAERTTCLIGRGRDCQLRLPDADGLMSISRHHCLLDINPPVLRIRDLGSRNGTFVNGRKIGQRTEGAAAGPPAVLECDLKDGDEIRIGGTVFRVRVCRPAVCARCQGEIPETRRAECELAPDIYQCPACRVSAQRVPPAAETAVLPARIRCSRCGRQESCDAEGPANSEYLCASCRSQASAVMRSMLAEAKTGSVALAAIRGYRVLSKLGAGGRGIVYLAEHEQSGERVALKLMLPEVAVDEDAKRRFLREIACTKLLQHPHIVALKDYGSDGGAFFFTLEYCSGGSVDRLLEASGGRLPPDEAVRILVQALDGIEYAHNVRFKIRQERKEVEVKGIVHRDLSPENLLLEGTVVKVADFGLSKAFDRAGMSGLTRTGVAAGKPYYMPRRQLVNFKYAKPDVDVWAAAACLYRLLTGSPPRDFRPEKDLFLTVLNTKPLPIQERDPRVPARLAAVIDAALAEKARPAFPTALELKRALERAL